MSLSFLRKFFYSQFFITPEYPKTSFAGKTVIVTGANVGLGKESAKHFVRLGVSTLVLACRNTEAGEAAKKEIEAASPGSKADVQVWKLDLSSYDSVQDFAESVSKRLSRVDAVICGAGMHTLAYRMAEDNEVTLTVNVVSTFLLALLMLPALKQTAARHNVRPSLVVVSSDLAGVAKLSEQKHAKPGHLFDALNDKSLADMRGRYSNSKLLVVLVIYRIGQLRPADSFPVTIDAMTPGFCYSELAREVEHGPLKYVVGAMKMLLARSTEVGSREYVHAVGTGGEQDKALHGRFLWNSQPTELMGIPGSRKGQEELAPRVWEELCGKLEKIRPGVTVNL